MSDEQAREEIAKLIALNSAYSEVIGIDVVGFYRDLKAMGYYQLPPELVRELMDDCSECGGTGKDYGADPPVKIPIPCSNCKDGKVGEPHLERLGVYGHLSLTDEELEIGRKAVEDALVDWRDNRLSELNRGNGLVIKERDGKDSDVIRFGTETALVIAIEAINKKRIKE